MNYYWKVIFAAIITFIFVTLAVINNWLQAISYCEGFGCLGRVFQYILIYISIIIAFIVYGYVFGTKPKLRSAIFAGCISIISIFLSIVTISINNQLEIEKSIQDHEKACIEYPILCPEKDT